MFFDQCLSPYLKKIKTIAFSGQVRKNLAYSKAFTQTASPPASFLKQTIASEVGRNPGFECFTALSAVKHSIKLIPPLLEHASPLQERGPGVEAGLFRFVQ
jgi:hypothetical protein